VSYIAQQIVKIGYPTQWLKEAEAEEEDDEEE
jgi:hypothetical protein